MNNRNSNTKRSTLCLKVKTNFRKVVIEAAPRDFVLTRR
jgi:hypothetical protein